MPGEITGGTIIKYYETNDSGGIVTQLAPSDFHGTALSFYYTDIAQNTYSTNHSKFGRAVCSLVLTFPFNVITLTAYAPAEASYYIEAPKVTSFKSEWANWPGTNEQPVGVRPYEANGDLELGLGGTPKNTGKADGITWTANVVAPPVIGGGEIAYNQQVFSVATRYYYDEPMEMNEGRASWMLDTTFPYPNINNPISVPVNTTLESNDSPALPLKLYKINPDTSIQLFDKYTKFDSFKTYLIYKPKGKDTIWITLSVINWGWSGTAEYNSTTSKWELTSGHPSGGGNGVPTSFLPEWTENIGAYTDWIDL